MCEGKKRGMHRNVLIFLVVALLVSPAAAQQAASVLDILAADPDGRFTDFITAMEAAEVLTAGDAPYTVFAPTNDAFGAALRELGTTQEGLLGNRDLLSALVGYHVIAGQASRVGQLNGVALQTVQGDELVVAANAIGQLFINGA